jgi:hypothetical protein
VQTNGVVGGTDFVVGGANKAWLAAGSDTTTSKKPGSTSAPLGMKGICRLITPTAITG